MRNIDRCCRWTVLAFALAPTSAAAADGASALPFRLHPGHLIDRLVAYLPTGPGAAWKEIERLTPGVELHAYEPDAAVFQQDGEVVVIFKERAPSEFRKLHPDALAVCQRERGLVFVLVREIEDFLKVNRTEPAFRIAVGRIIAHELQHVQRGAPHDEAGLFKPQLSREDLLRREER